MVYRVALALSTFLVINTYGIKFVFGILIARILSGLYSLLKSTKYRFVKNFPLHK